MKIDTLLCNGRKRLSMSYHYEGSHGSSKCSTGEAPHSLTQRYAAARPTLECVQDEMMRVFDPQSTEAPGRHPR